MTTQPSDALRCLRASTRGHLQTDADTVRPVRYVIDRKRGVLVMPLPRDIDTTEAQLLVPDEHDPALAALITLEPVDAPAPAAEIRFEVYHGPAREGTWADARVQAVRYHSEAFDADEFTLIDRLLGDEPALCRELNADTDALRALCRRRASADVVDPVAVGVDPHGIDVRARFGVVRVEFASCADDLESARAQIHALGAPSA